MNTELEQRLRADMERATQAVRIPPGLARRAYRHQHQRAMRTRVMTAAGGTAVLIAGTLTVAGVTGAFGRSPAGPQARTTAYVVSRVEHALSAPGMTRVIAYTRTVYPAGITFHPVPGGMNGLGGPGGSSARGGDHELLWASLHTTVRSVFTATGRRLFDERITLGYRSLTTTVVNYTNRTWWTAQSPRPAATGPGSASCLKITGSSGRLTLWVNAATYLPMRLDQGGLQTDFQWLPPTPAHEAMLNMPVPAGFHQVPPPA
jgi:hypothetical protein